MVGQKKIVVVGSIFFLFSTDCVEIIWKILNKFFVQTNKFIDCKLTRRDNKIINLYLFDQKYGPTKKIATP